jgi:hypothetical protein
MRTLVAYIVLALGLISEAQPQAPWVMFDTGAAKGRYLLSRTYEEGNDHNVSLTIICDSLTICRTGTVKQVAMSNAYVYQTRIPRPLPLSLTGAVEQTKLFASEFTMGVLKNEKVIFNNAVTNFVDLAAPNERRGRMVSYEGEALEVEMRRQGMRPPEDADMREDTGKKRK